MIDSNISSDTDEGGDYVIGQDLYAASLQDMRIWAARLRRDILRLEAEIEKKQNERAAADSLFKKPE